MKILFLSPHKHLIPFLESNGDIVIQSIDKLNDEILDGVDFIISYGYRHRIMQDVIDRFKDRAINLHVSYLPWNRGADPNLWSALENTPRGVTIHMMDGSIDTGPLLAQKLDDWLPDDTMRSSYYRLHEVIEDLFKKYWPEIRNGQIEPLPQITYHRIRDKEKYQSLLTDGWDTPIKDLLGRGKP